MRQFIVGFLLGSLMTGALAGWYVSRQSSSTAAVATPSATSGRGSAPISAPAATPPVPARTTAGPAQTSPRSTTVAATRPILVSAGFEKALMAARSGAFAHNPAADMHAKVLGEARDDAWAVAAESDTRQFIDDYLTRHGIDRSLIDVPVIECRASLCELQILVDQSLTRATSDQWSRLQFELARAQLSSGSSFDDMSSSMFGNPEFPAGRVGIVLFLSRTPGR
jgi:hypothetical protein